MSDKLTLAQVQDMYGQLPTFKEAFYDWWGANEGLFKLINGIHSPAYDNFMLFVTQLGDKHFFLPYMGLLAVYVGLALLIGKIQRRAALRQQCIMWFGVFAVLFAGFAAAMIVAYGFKELFALPRPYVALPSFDVTLVERLESEKSYRSFPSGHVTMITIMIMGMWPMLSPHMKMLGLFLIALVAWSRVALGVHFPADTVWAFIITSTVVIMVRFVLYRLFRALFGINCGPV